MIEKPFDKYSHRMEILWEFHQSITKELSRKDIAHKAYIKAKKSLKRIDNTLGLMATKRLIIRPHRGKNSLSPKQVQEFESCDSLPREGSEESKTNAGPAIIQLRDSFTQGTSGTSHKCPGKKIRKPQEPSHSNRSDTISSYEIDTSAKIKLQGSGFDIGDIEGDHPHC